MNKKSLGIFWDIENCQVPKGKSAVALVQRIREKSLVRYHEAEFLCVCDVNKESKIVIRELNLSQVTVVHVCATSKNAADDKLKQCMRRFVNVHGERCAVLLISNDINFAVDLSDFRHRYNIRILLLHTYQAPKALLSLAHEHCDFFELASELRFRSPIKFPSEPCELEVTNLPDNVSSYHIRNVLKRLSDNCGGKVQWINGTFAILRFRNAGEARRAQKRMDKEKIFGRKISVNFPQAPSISSTHTREEPSSCFPGQNLTVEKEPVCDRRISVNFLHTPSTSSTQFPVLCAMDRPMSLFPKMQEKHQNTEKYFSTLNNLWFLNRDQLLSVASMVVQYLSDIESHNRLTAIQLPNADPEGNTILNVMKSNVKNSVLTQTSPSGVEMVVNVSITTPLNHCSKRQRKQKNISTLLNEVQIVPIVGHDLTDFGSQKSQDVSVEIGKENRNSISMIGVTDSSSTRKKTSFSHLQMFLHSSGRKSRTSEAIGTVIANKQVKSTEDFENTVIQLFSTAEINTIANDKTLSNCSGPSAKHILTDHCVNSSKEEMARRTLRQHQEIDSDSSSLQKRQASPIMPTSCVKRPRRNPMRKAKCKRNI